MLVACQLLEVDAKTRKMNDVGMQCNLPCSLEILRGQLGMFKISIH